MSNYKPKGKYTVKKSSGIASTETLKTLQKMLLERAGSVTYIFSDTRITNIHADKLKDMKEVEERGMLHVNLNPKSFEGKTPGSLKTPNELIEMFETTKADLGAKSFVLN